MGLEVSENGGGGGGAEFYRLNAKLGCVQSNEMGPDGKALKGEDGKNIKKHHEMNTALTGYLVGLSVVDNVFEGAINKQLRLKLKDDKGGPNMFVDLPFGSEANGASAFGLSVMAKLNAAGLDQPVSLVPWNMPAGTKMGNRPATEKAMTGCVVKQGGVKLVEDYGNGETKLPQLQPVLQANGKPVMVGGKELKDKAPWEDLAFALLDTLTAKVSPSHQDVETGAEPEHESDEGIDVDDMTAGTQVAAAARPGFAAR